MQTFPAKSIAVLFLYYFLSNTELNKNKNKQKTNKKEKKKEKKMWEEKGVLCDIGLVVPYRKGPLFPLTFFCFVFFILFCFLFREQLPFFSSISMALLFLWQSSCIRPLSTVFFFFFNFFFSVCRSENCLNWKDKTALSVWNIVEPLLFWARKRELITAEEGTWTRCAYTLERKNKVWKQKIYRSTRAWE